MANPRVEIMGQDIFALGYISDIIDIKEYKTFRKDKFIVNEISFDVDNYNNFFSINHPKSMFHGSRWQYGTCKIWDENETLIWDGILKDIRRKHNTKKAKVISLSTLHKFKDKDINYVSSTWETPGDAFKNICDSINFTAYNQRVLQASIDQFNANNCFIKCNFQSRANTKFNFVVEKLAEISASDLYSHLGNAYFKHWQLYTGGVKKYLVDDDYEKVPEVFTYEKDLANNYEIRYAGDNGFPATDINGNNIGMISRQDEYNGEHDLPPIDGSEEGQIIIKDKVSAVYLGESLMRRVHLNLETQPAALQGIKFDLKLKHRDWITLDTFCRVSLSDEGWDEKLFEISRSNISEKKRIISLEAWEVQS